MILRNVTRGHLSLSDDRNRNFLNYSHLKVCEILSIILEMSISDWYLNKFSWVSIFTINEYQYLHSALAMSPGHVFTSTDGTTENIKEKM